MKIIILILTFIFTSTSFLSAKESGIYPKHPRVLIRQESWGSGITVENLRKRTERGDCLTAWQRIKNGDAESRGIPTAAIGYLITGDESYAKKTLKMMKGAAQGALDSSEIWSQYEMLNDLSIGFDWIYNSPSFDAVSKKEMADKMARLANKMTRYLNSDYHIFSRGMAQIASVGMIGLALWGEHVEADKFISFANEKLKNIFAAFQYLDGTWPEGLGYLNEVRLPCLLEFLEAYKSATEPSYDYFKEIQQNQGDWLRRLLYFHIYNLRPDYTWARFGDISSYKAFPKDNFAQNLVILTHEYKDTYGQDFLVKLERAIAPEPIYYRGYVFKYLLFYDLSIPVSPGVNELPKEAMFGKDSLGYAVVRSGWGIGDVFFRFNCGDYFTGHQHSDQGNFELFKYAPLAIDSGYYSEWGSNHRENYYSRTVAHNTMTIFQPEEKFQSSYKNAGINDGGQRVVWYYRGSTQQQSFTLSDYLAKKKTGAHYETGDITNFEADNNYAYINADITNAYNNPEFSAENNKPKITEFKRQIVVLKPAYFFIIFDKLSSVKPEYKKAWLLHSVTEPVLMNAKPVDAGLGYAAYASGIVRIDNEKGRLFCTTVYPDKPRITIIGGPGYEFWANGYNQDQGVPLTFEKHAESGAWRIEVEPSVPSEDDIFLHVLYPCDVSTESMPPVAKIEGQNLTGVQIEERIVLFRKHKDAKEKISYRFDSKNGISHHLLFNVSPKVRYRIKVINIDTLKTAELSSESTGSGILRYTIQSPAQSKLKIEINNNV